VSSHLTYDVIVDRDFIEQEHIIMIKRSSEILIKQLPAISNKFEAMIDINFSNATTE